MSEFYMNSVGKGKIYCRLWEPEAAPRGIVQIVHGIAEYIDRYDGFARFLNANGYLVAAEDHMGHGKSLAADDVKGYFTGGWDAAVEDTHRLQVKTMSEHPGIPYVMFGHSMGSFMTRNFLFRYPGSGISAAVISGTGWQPEAALTAGKLLCSLEIAIHGATGHSGLINQLLFGSYNKAFEPKRTAFDWLSSDPQTVDRYVADDLCGFDATIGLSRDMLSGIHEIQKPENLAKMQKDLPIYFMSGAKDPVGNDGVGVRKTVEAFQKAGMEQVTMKLYDNGRHEMLNEVNHEAVYADILAFLCQIPVLTAK